MALYGSLATIRAQTPKADGFAIAFAYLDELLTAGSAVQTRVKGIALDDTIKTELTGGVFVIEQAYATRMRADGFFESHRKSSTSRWSLKARN